MTAPYDPNADRQARVHNEQARAQDQTHATAPTTVRDPNAIPPLSDAQKADIRAHQIATEATLERRMGPGETPKRAADTIHHDGTRRRGEVIGTMSAEDAEEFGNPIIPRDMSGHKVHPSDAYSIGAISNVGRSQGFGGSGLGVQADQRTHLDQREAAMSKDGHRVVEKIDPITGELVRTKIGAGGEVLDEQREPAPKAARTEEQARARYRDDRNGPLS